MKTRWKFAFLWAAASILFAGNPSSEFEKRHYRSLDEGTNEAVILSARYDLELRHANGPRPDRVDALLKLRAKFEDPAWGADVVSACRDRLVDCKDFVSIAAAVAARDTDDSPVAAARRYNYDLIIREASLQSMKAQDRHTLYLKALRQGTAVNSGIEIDAWNAADRALDEAMLDLLPSIRKAESDWPIHHWEVIEGRNIRLAEALASSDPKRELVKLVREGVDAGQGSYAEVTAAFALQELRRLNQQGTVEDLKAVMELFLPAKEKQELRIAEKTQMLGHAIPSREMPAPNEYLGSLGPQIAEVIGDLGDRDFERTTLGGRTLWDQVNEVEIRLHKAGKLPLSEMVSN